MSTNAYIGYTFDTPEGPDTIGTSVNYDGYPSGVGYTLYRLMHNKSSEEIKQLMTTLIHDYPAGWSELDSWDGESTSILSFEEYREFEYILGFNTTIDWPVAVYYDEKGTPIYWDGYTDKWIEYAYIIDIEQRIMTIYHGLNVIDSIDLTSEYDLTYFKSIDRR